jgi:hypothetical protein
MHWSGPALQYSGCRCVRYALQAVLGNHTAAHNQTCWQKASFAARYTGAYYASAASTRGMHVRQDMSPLLVQRQQQQ